MSQALDVGTGCSVWGAGGPAEFLGGSAAAGFDGVPFDVAFDVCGFGVIPNEAVVTFVLPEGVAVEIKDLGRAMAGKTFQRPDPFGEGNERGHEHVDVIRHDYAGLQVIAPEFLISVEDTFGDDAGNVRPRQVNRPGFCSIQDSVHRYEGLSGRHSARRKDSVCRQASVESEGYEYPCSHHIPMGKASLVDRHHEISAELRSFSHTRERRAEARRQGRSPAPQVYR
jgi:hypothetical protein